jgi:Tfp pilus assembly protein PilN
MATTLVHEPVREPSVANAPTADGQRFVAVRAMLLPDEIVTARRIEAVRRQVLFGVATVFALLVAWFGLSWWQTTTARSDLSDATHHGAALLLQQNQFHQLVSAQVETAQIHDQLTALMTDDVPWSKVLGRLRANAPDGITLTTVTATMNVAGTAASTTAQTTLNGTGQPTVGSLTIAGVATNKTGVAAYADRLNQIPGMTGALITSVTTVNHSVNFTLTAALTSQLLGGRYAPAAPAAPGAHTGGN